MIGMIGPVLGRLKRDRRGILAVEMAIATPVVIGLLLSGIEVTRYVLLNQKIERASATMADLVSRSLYNYAVFRPRLSSLATINPYLNPYPVPMVRTVRHALCAGARVLARCEAVMY